jgi:hypothetical protein
MKRQVAILMLLGLTKIFMAQNWCPPGATWFYHVDSYINSIKGFIEFNYTSDTTVNSVACKKISGTFRGWKPIQTYTTIPNFKTYFSYESNSVVYIAHGNTFDTVVNYKANIGDKWLRTRGSSEWMCNSRKALTVVDTGHIMINNNWLRKIVTTYTNTVIDMISGDTNTVSYQNTFIEKVHHSTADIEIFPYYCETDNAIVEWLYMGFRCYQDNSFGNYNVRSFGCNSISGFEGTSPEPAKLLVFPNPSNTFVDLEFDNKINRIVLCNPLGAIITQKILSTHPARVDISDLPNGIYFIKAYNNERCLIQQKLIKN